MDIKDTLGRIGEWAKSHKGLALLILLFLAIAALITWYVRRMLARKRLIEIDEGRRCMAC